MNKWRPEGWENPYKDISAWSDDEITNRFGNKRQWLIDNVFEAGANAMLKAINGEIEKVENPYQRLSVFSYPSFEHCRQKIRKALEANEL